MHGNTTEIQSVILADNQDITAAGIVFFIQQVSPLCEFIEVRNKENLINQLTINAAKLIILDYTFFNFTSVDELLILQHRFPIAHFLLFSEELTDNFLTRILCNNKKVSILLKDCSKKEIQTALTLISQKENFICERIKNQLSIKKTDKINEEKKLTPTERDVLKSIALGKSTKEIAAERFSSTHTVITHRKNIFRKLEVNNVHEATKYALRAGIIDSAEYYI